MRTLRLKRYLWIRLHGLLDVLRVELGLSISEIYRADQAGVATSPCLSSDTAARFRRPARCRNTAASQTDSRAHARTHATFHVRLRARRIAPCRTTAW
jgi:hypothetical protein